MNKIPTAEEFLTKWIEKFKETFSGYASIEEIKKQPEFKSTIECMIEFAKLHAEAQQEAILEKGLVHQKCNNYHSGETVWEDKSSEVYVTVHNDNSYDEHHSVSIDKSSIINAYPLDNIK